MHLSWGWGRGCARACCYPWAIPMGPVYRHQAGDKLEEGDKAGGRDTVGWGGTSWKWRASWAGEGHGGDGGQVGREGQVQMPESGQPGGPPGALRVPALGRPTDAARLCASAEDQRPEATALR